MHVYFIVCIFRRSRYVKTLIALKSERRPTANMIQCRRKIKGFHIRFLHPIAYEFKTLLLIFIRDKLLECPNLFFRMVLLSEGLGGMERELSLDSLLEYFRGNAGRLNYCDRLADGRVIGSGLVEGACKNLVGRRLKQTGACWRKGRANKIARVCGVLYSHQWKNAWKNNN